MDERRSISATRLCSLKPSPSLDFWSPRWRMFRWPRAQAFPRLVGPPGIRVIDSWASILQRGRKSVTALKLGSRWPPSRCPPPTSQRPPSQRRKRRRLVHLCVQRWTARPSLRWPADLQLCSPSSEPRGRLTPQLWFSFPPQELFF